MASDFIVVVNVLLQICCHIGSGMSCMRIFVEEVFVLLGTLTVKLMWKLACGQNKNI